MDKDKKFSLEDEKDVILYNKDTGDSVMEFSSISSKTESETEPLSEWEVIDIEKYSITFKNTSSSAYLHLDIDTDEPFNERMKIGDKVNMRLGDDDYYAN